MWLVNFDKIIKHLVYIYDSKRFAKNHQRIEELLTIVEKFSDTISLKYGLNKCEKAKFIRRKMVEISTGNSSELNVLKGLEPMDSYKNMQVFYDDGIKQCVILNTDETHEIGLTRSMPFSYHSWIIVSIPLTAQLLKSVFFCRKIRNSWLCTECSALRHIQNDIIWQERTFSRTFKNATNNEWFQNWLTCIAKKLDFILNLHLKHVNKWKKFSNKTEKKYTWMNF